MQKNSVNYRIVRQEQEEPGLLENLPKFLKYWPLFLALAIIGVTGAYIYLKFTLPVYETSATILIKDENKGLGGSDILESLDIFQSSKIVDNEIEVLRSRNIVKEVINNLQMYANLYEEGRLKNVSGYLNSPVKVEIKDPEKLHETPKDEKEYYSYNDKKSSVNFNNHIYSLNEWFEYNGDSIRFIANRKYVQPETTKPLFFTLTDVKKQVNSLIGRLDISATTKQSTVINLKLTDEVPVRGEDILNELLVQYNEAAIKDKNALAANTLAFVEDRLKYVVADLDSVETAMQNYKKNKGIIDISEQGKTFLNDVADNDKKLNEMNIQLAVLNQVEEYVMSKDNKEGIVPATLGVNDPVLSQLLQTLYDLQIQYEKLRKTTARNNPILLSIADQIEKVKPDILENIKNQRLSLTAARQKVATTSNQFTAMMASLPQKERELVQISRQQSIKNNIYTFLLEKREETALSFASAVADSRVVNSAQSGMIPLSPKKGSIYAMAILAAFAIGVVIVLLKETINKKVSFRTEFEKLLTWPVIGELACATAEKRIVVNEGQRSVIAEQFRQIRTKLAYFGINSTKKTILVTSSITQEGKSFIAANLATSLALTGKKVVLLEFDLRKPNLSQIFNVKRDEGITNYIIGSSDIIDIIKSTETNPNLFIIPSGPIAPNPSELILNEKVDLLFEYLKESFDYILIDTAPVVPVTDAEILSKYADATLFVVRQDYTPVFQLKKLRDDNITTNLNNVGIIYNSVKGRGKNGYGNSYSYAYPYASDDSKESLPTNIKKIFNRSKVKENIC